MTAALFIRVTATIAGCLQLLLSSFSSFQRSIDLCILCAREKKEGGGEGGREEEGGKEGKKEERREGRKKGGRKEGKKANYGNYVSHQI